MSQSESKDDRHRQTQNIEVVPWYDAAQFKKVYEYLFSHELAKKRWALDQIAVWNKRCHPSLPVAIEATYGIASASVQHALWSDHGSLNQHVDIQHLYSSAITRFVNLTVERNSQFPGRMAKVAQGLGIPTFIVDMRNEASHSFKPSIPCLKIAADSAIKFLKESYWDKEYARVNNYVKKLSDEAELKSLLDIYIAKQLRVLVNADNNKIGDDPQDLADLRLELYKIIQNIESWTKKDVKLFIKVLTEAAFIPNDIAFKDIVSEGDFLQFKYKDDKDEADVNYDKVIPKVPEYHEKMWHDIIFLLNARGAIPLFLESLLKTQANRTVIGQKLLISWVIKLLRIHSIGGSFETTPLRKIFSKNGGIVIQWNRLFYAALANPCKYVIVVLPLILCHLDLPKKVTQRVLNLVAIYLGQVKDDDFTVANLRIFNVEDLKKTKKLQMIARKENDDDDDDSTNNIWSYPSNDLYKTWPMSKIVNPVKEEEMEQPQQVEFSIEDFAEKHEFVEKYIIKGNENEEREEETAMDITIPYFTYDRMREEFNKRKTFLYN